MLARTDYSANLGDKFVYWGGGPPPSKAEMGEGFLEFTALGPPVPIAQVSGVVMQRQPILTSQIRDGLSQTYFAGEKWLPPEDYESGENLADDQSCWNGDDLDMMGSTEVPPAYDGGKPNWQKGPFGSAHRDGLNMVNCDASVRFVTYQIDPDVYRKFGNRYDARTGPSAN
jgi:hypothetical protein